MSIHVPANKRTRLNPKMIRATFKHGEMKLTFRGKDEELSTKLVREKISGVMDGAMEKTVMQLVEGERGIVLEGIKRGDREMEYRYEGGI